MSLEGIGLRPYQTEDIGKIAAEFLTASTTGVSQRGRTRLLGVWPTAGGKTILAACLFKEPSIKTWLNSFPATHRKMLFIAHSEELLKQAKGKILRYNPQLKVEIEQAEKWASPDADVVVASVQTLASRKGRRLMRFDKDQFRIVVVDEAHHAAAPTYLSALQYFDFLPGEDFMPKPGPQDVDVALKFQRERLAAWDRKGMPQRLLLGITATPARGDKVGLELVFQKIAFKRTILELIRAGFLSHIKAFRIESTINLDWVHTKGGDFDQVELATAVDNEERNRLIVKAWLQHAPGRKTIAFCANIHHAEELARAFRDNGVKASTITGKTIDREALLEGFSGDELELLTNYAVLTEGYDEPNIQCIIAARPTKSPTLLTQMIGRGLRLAQEQGKQDCVVLDIVDVTRKHSLMTAPTLVGLPSEFDAKGGDLSEAIEKVEKLQKENPLLDVSGARSLDELEMRAHEVDLFGPFEDAVALAHGSLAWLKLPDGSFEVSYPGAITRETLRIAPNTLGQYEVARKEYDESRPIVQPSADLSEAFRKAELWLTTNFPGQANFLKRDSNSRKQSATPAQKGKLTRLGITNIKHDKLNKGQASDLISLFESQKAA